MRILLVDDEKSIAVTLGDALKRAKHDVTIASDGEQALDSVKGRPFDLIISDIRMPKVDGVTLLELAKQQQPDVDVILMTAYGTIEAAVDALKKGAFDYLQKPFMNADMLVRVDRVEQMRRLRAEVQQLRAELGERHSFGALIGKSPKMQKVYELVEAVAKTDANVLIEGESGTGKELIAEAIHFNSGRRDQPLVKMSCSVFPETLIEDELFGHVRGAFTDARSDKTGRFERANRGSIFIDDIDDLKGTAQQKLLRVTQEREFERIGDTKTTKVDVRIIAATKVDLWTRVKSNQFREDLYFRLNVVKVALPPLRERIEDVPILLGHFIKRIGKGRAYTISPETMMALQSYGWPGNVRELENAVDRAIAMADEALELRREHLLAPVTVPGTTVMPTSPLSTLSDAVAAMEAKHIRNVIAHTGGSRTEAARILGITTKNLWEKMKKHGIEG